MSQGKFNTLTPDHQTGYTIVGITNMRIMFPCPIYCTISLTQEYQNICTIFVDVLPPNPYSSSRYIAELETNKRTNKPSDPT